MIFPDPHRAAIFLKWLGIFSIFTFILSIALIPWLIGFLPADYFLAKGTVRSSRRRFTLTALIWGACRNLVGVALLVAGVAMLFLPGQGILTILIGISLTNFPGKRTLIQKLIQRPSVRQGLNWLREKTNKPIFVWDEENS